MEGNCATGIVERFVGAVPARCAKARCALYQQSGRQRQRQWLTRRRIARGADCLQPHRGLRMQAQAGGVDIERCAVHVVERADALRRREAQSHQVADPESLFGGAERAANDRQAVAGTLGAFDHFLLAARAVRQCEQHAARRHRCWKAVAGANCQRQRGGVGWSRRGQRGRGVGKQVFANA